MQFEYYPLAIRKEKERSSIPGVVITAARRGANRHRRDDLLAALLHVDGDLRFEMEEIQTLAEDAASIFFGAQGSVTRAMQQAVENINRVILERNLDRGYEGIRADGSVCLAVVHNGWLFVCQYGATGAMLVSDEKFETFGNKEGAGENLGQSKRIIPRYYQSEIKADDLLLINQKIPQTWSSYYLAGSAALDMEQVRRRLLNQVTADIEAVVIKVREGSTQVRNGDWQTQAEESLVEEKTAPEPAGDLPGQDAQVLPETEIKVLSSDDEITNFQVPDRPVESQTIHKTDALSDQEPSDAIPVVPGETESIGPPSGEGQNIQGAAKPPSLFLFNIARAWMNMRTFNARFRLGFDRLRKKIMPKSNKLEEPSASGLMVILSILLPLGLVLLALSAYTRIGKNEQFDAYMAQAQEAAELARLEKDAVQQHAYWSDALSFVKSAEKYHITQESRMLYEQAQYLLDDMDLAARLDFRPALTQYFPQGMAITQIQASSSGVYLLDATSGSILRIFLNTKGFYEIDDEFSCAPGPYGLETVTQLVDFITLPANQDNFRVMAVDQNGNLLYCRPGEVPVSRTLPTPENGWERISSVSYADHVLYVMDAGRSAIWMYKGKDPNQPESATATGIVFSESAVSFLDEEIPDLGGALDLIINQQDVYILHQDGHMTHCRYSSEKEVRLTECQDPIPYTDNRVGREDKKPWLFSDAKFIAIQNTRLSGASIYILDNLSPSIYQFSYQLNLEHVLRPQYNRSYPLPEISPTGFGVSPDLDVFLAFENKLFIAPLK